MENACNGRSMENALYRVYLACDYSTCVVAIFYLLNEKCMLCYVNWFVVIVVVAVRPQHRICGVYCSIYDSKANDFSFSRMENWRWEITVRMYNGLRGSVHA